jgi:hypothetical protein
MKTKPWRWCLPVLAVGLTVIPPRSTGQAAAGEPAGDRPDTKPLRFAFGTPTSVTRPGFTKVTADDGFSPAKGFGFQSTQGLSADDRGGSEIVRPSDEYTARTYGAYRTTSDLTCAFIEGTIDNAFVVALPDGEYTVWLVASDAEADPPLFEIWANGQKKLDTRIPRARFVFLESFEARATEGRLKIEFKGRHGWLLNGLVIGHAGAELDDTITTLERDIFFLTAPELPNWTERRAEAGNPALEWTAAERQQGYAVFAADYTEPMTRAFVPARAAIGKPLTAFATPGEFEPTTFCLTACQDLGEVTLELSGFVADKARHTIARQNVKVGIVRCWPQRAVDRGGKGEYQIVPERIEAPTGRMARVAAGQVRQWWLTVRVPPDTPAGRYRMWLTLRPEKAPPTLIEWRLLVLPFPLVRPPAQHWGTWWESFPPVGGLRGPERRGRNTAAEEARLVQADLADYRDHGFDLAIFNYYFGVKESPEGSFTYDISKLVKDLDYWKTLGTDTPVAIGCEYTFRNLEYALADPGQKHIPGTFSLKARAAIVGLVRHIRDEAQRRGWPKLYFYPIDEPGNNKTENRMRFAENVLDLVHEVPGCETATTVGASDVQRLGDRVDVRIYAYGSYSRRKVLEETRQGHPFWYYENGMFYGHSTVASRGLTGFEFLRSGAEVATAWGFDCTTANPDNDFDGGHKDWNVIFPGVDAPTPTIYWELCREGVDDCRYVATLQQHIRWARERGPSEAARRAERVLEPLLDPEAAPIRQPLAFQRYRWRIAREILALQGDRKLALTFAAVADNPLPPVTIGPNLVRNPSFEDPAQADGSPPGQYHLGYPESKASQLGALSVSDEAAHSGRFSLKWDLSKVAEAGPVRQDPRWLVVNVAFAGDTARELRGKRVKVGYWLRMGAGSTVPGLGLRQNLTSGPGEGSYYGGGIEDPAVWNHFETEGRLSENLESMDIHTWVAVPEAELAQKSFFYMDDVTLQVVEEPPVSLSTALDEYYVGEAVPWSVRTISGKGTIRVALRRDDRQIAEQIGRVENGQLQGAFPTRGLRPAVYLLEATLAGSSRSLPTARRQFVLAPNPFDWPVLRP